MKCLSLWQPWASLVVLGEKSIETRSWETRYTGPLLIHAGKKWTNDLWLTARQGMFGETLEKHGFVDPDKLPFGAIIGIVDLVKCWPTDDLDVIRVNGQPLTDKEMIFGNYDDGRFAWLLSKPRWFENPIPVKAWQKIFNVPDAVVADQLAKARTA